LSGSGRFHTWCFFSFLHIDNSSLFDTQSGDKRACSRSIFLQFVEEVSCLTGVDFYNDRLAEVKTIDAEDGFRIDDGAPLSEGDGEGIAVGQVDERLDSIRGTKNDINGMQWKHPPMCRFLCKSNAVGPTRKVSRDYQMT